ncbi:MAG TPA: imelysin family protein [Candidatus Binatia bacterium]|nr:imelysin family protein [Candidatus Binatia bacterium]
MTSRPASGQLRCAGDCDRDGVVRIDELIQGVRRALGALPSDACIPADASGDGLVGVDELVAAVRRAIDGCVAEAVTRRAVAVTYANLLFANYRESERLARELRDAVNAFLEDPTQNGLEAAKAAWIVARPIYLQTEMARFYGGPIDNEEDGPEGLLNAWPLDEAYIDYVESDPLAGTINDPATFPEISRELLVSLNELEGEDSISTGWHAIEFLLWGQDLDPDGPGSRPFTDYVTGAGGTAANQQRRATYLRVVADLLVDNLRQVKDAWAPGRADNYRAEFLSIDADQALRRILTGMGTLSGGELTGERLAVPFDTKDQEDEHSCFSDNTHIDHRFDATGIQNAYLGRYGTLNGPGISDLVRHLDPTLDDRARATIQAAVDAVFAIPPPFERAIRGADDAPGRVAIAAAIDALNAQTDVIGEVAQALGIPISTTLP